MFVKSLSLHPCVITILLLLEQYADIPEEFVTKISVIPESDVAEEDQVPSEEIECTEVSIIAGERKNVTTNNCKLCATNETRLFD